MRMRSIRHAAVAAITLLLLGAATIGHAATVAVDVGHTPKHVGARGAAGGEEYAFNRALGRRLVDLLAMRGFVVIRVGGDGREIELRQRTAQAAGADLFVSIHHDSLQQAWIDAGRRGEFSGYALFVSEKNPDYPGSLRCAKTIGEQLRGAGEAPSLYHATPIAGENRPIVDELRGVHRFDDLVVLKTATMPAVLVEAGVIANPQEEIRLGKPATRERLAQAIADGITRCLQP